MYKQDKYCGSSVNIHRLYSPVREELCLECGNEPNGVLLCSSSFSHCVKLGCICTGNLDGILGIVGSHENVAHDPLASRAKASQAFFCGALHPWSWTFCKDTRPSKVEGVIPAPVSRNQARARCSHHGPVSGRTRAAG